MQKLNKYFINYLVKLKFILKYLYIKGKCIINYLKIKIF
jgi:hypothetical protein